MLSVNSVPEDFSVKSQLRVSRDLDTSSTAKADSEVDPLNGGFDLTPNNQATDLRFNMYSDKRTNSPVSSIYRNNPDPYLGSGAQNGDRSSNGSGNHSGQDEFDLPTHQGQNFASASADLAPTLPSYLDSNDNPVLGVGDNYPSNDLRNRSNSGPPGKFNLNGKMQNTDYRPSSTNSFTNSKNNSASDARGSPGATNQIPSSGVPSPLSPSCYSASGAERSSMNPFSASALGYKSSAFRPLPSNAPNLAHYGQHNPHSYGPRPPLPGNSQHIPGYISPGMMDPNALPHSYPSQSVDYDYGNTSYKKRQNSSIDNDSHQSSQPENTPPGVNEQTSQNPQEGDQGKKVVVPADPMKWTQKHVREWVDWTITEYNLSGVNPSCFDKMDGKSLCALTKEDFHRIVNSRHADVFISHLQYLIKHNGASLPNLSSDDVDNIIQQGGGQFRHPGPSTTRGSYADPPYFDVHSSGNRGSVDGSNPQPPIDPYQLFGPTSARLSNPGSGQIQLWQFLLELLSDPSNALSITWEGIHGEFKMVDPDDVARRWGERKSKPNMNYDKLSRALRYYYDKNIMTKVHGKRYAYKFDFQGLAASLHPQPDQTPFNPDYKNAMYRSDVGFPHHGNYPYPIGPLGSGFVPQHPKHPYISSHGRSPPYHPHPASIPGQYSWPSDVPNYSPVPALPPPHTHQALPPTSFYN